MSKPTIMPEHLPRPFQVIFDMDGVIFDTERFFLDCCIPAAEKLGMPDIEAISLQCIGLTKEETDRRMQEFYGPDAPLREFEQEVSRIFRSRYEEMKHMPIKPGAPELLQALSQRQVPLALASSTRIAIVEEELKDAGLHQYFDVIIGGDMVQRSKPAPDIFLKAAERLGAIAGRPGEADETRVGASDSAAPRIYVIEDSFNGVRAAHSAGMLPIMVPDLLQPDEQIRGLAHRVMPSLVEVRAWLEEQLG